MGQVEGGTVVISDSRWAGYKKTDRPVWFWVVENIQDELSEAGAPRGFRVEIIQRVKQEALKQLSMRGDMLNMREKHIPRVKEIYITVLEMFGSLILR